MKVLPLIVAIATVSLVCCKERGGMSDVLGSSGATSQGANPCSASVAPLLDTLFSSLGNDCSTYASLFANDAKYYHQHDGFKSRSELLKNCQNYAAFCPGNSCKFLQNGEPILAVHENKCRILVPYLWSELPANNKAKGNLEPHTGWEFIVATPDSSSRFGYRMNYFAELESSYSVAFNWANPDQTPAVVTQSTLQLLALKNSASKGECNNPIAPTLTAFFSEKSRGTDTWRQQGDAIVLAAGGYCQVALPYAAQVADKLKTGQFILALQPTANNTYTISGAAEFPRAAH